MSICLTFIITDSLIACSNGVCFWTMLVLGLSVISDEPSAVGVLEAFFSGELVLGGNVEPAERCKVRKH